MTTSLRARGIAFVSAVALLTLALGVAPATAIGDPIITGNVTSEGSPVSGLLVQAIPDVFGDPFITDTTAADGSYHLDGVPAASYTVNIFDIDDDWMDDFGVPVTISLDNPTAVVNFSLSPWPVGTSTVHGVITDSGTGLPVEGASVNFNGSGTARSTSALTLADGIYSFGLLPAGFYSINVSVSGYVNKLVTFQLDDADDLPLAIAVTPADARITGAVTDSTLTPVPDGLFVFLSLDSDSAVMGNTMTSGGTYSFPDIGAGTYTIRMGGPGTDWMATSQSVTAIAGATVTADFTLEARVSSDISGTIFNADGTVTLEGICVDAYDAIGDVVGGNPMGGTDADGTYVVPDLEAGDYRLLFWDCDYTRVPAYALTFFGPANSLTYATAITLAGGVDVTGTDIELGLGGTIAGTINVQAAGGVVDFPGGRGMDATVFQLVDGDWEPMPDPSPFVGAGDIGDYQASGLPTGTYRVGFVDGSFAGIRAYAAEYWDDSATIAGATGIAVTAGVTTAGIDATVRIPRPGDPPAAVATADLTAAEEGEIAADSAAAIGELIEVAVDSNLAGEWISVWGHSTPVLLGDWVQVSPAGTVTVPVSSALAAGPHQLVAQDAEGAVIGWVPIEIAARPALTALPNTGLSLANLIVPLGLAFALLAFGIVLIRHRRAWGDTR